MLRMIPQTSDFQKQCYKVLQGELALATPPCSSTRSWARRRSPTAYSKYLELALKGQIKFEEMLTKIENEVNAAIKDGISAIMG